MTGCDEQTARTIRHCAPHRPANHRLQLHHADFVDGIPSSAGIKVAVSVHDSIMGRLDQAKNSVIAKNTPNPSSQFRTSGLIQ
jgi:hypothetical protein